MGPEKDRKLTSYLHDLVVLLISKYIRMKKRSILSGCTIRSERGGVVSTDGKRRDVFCDDRYRITNPLVLVTERGNSHSW